MKKQIIEPDFIGGQGSLTKEEEQALASYFARKRNKKTKPGKPTLTQPKTRRKENSLV